MPDLDHTAGLADLAAAETVLDALRPLSTSGPHDFTDPTKGPVMSRALSRARLLPAGALLLALALTACASPSTSEVSDTGATSTAGGSTRPVETAFGTVEIPTDPQRTIALEGGVGPLLGAGITPIATADGDYAESFLPEEYVQVKDLPIILGPDGLDFEKIASLEPDLLIGFVRGGTEEELSAEVTAQFEKLQAIAPTVLIRATGSAQTKDATLRMSEALGDGEDGAQAKAAELSETYADVLETTVFAPLDYYEKVYVYSPISWPGDTVTDAGGTLTDVSAQETTENVTFLSAEGLTTIDDATVVLYEETVNGMPGEGAVELQALPTYASLPAVREGHAFGLKYFFANRYETGLESLKSLETTLQALRAQQG